MSGQESAPPSAHRAARSIPMTPGRALPRRSGADLSSRDFDRVRGVGISRAEADSWQYLRRLSAVQHSTRKAMRVPEEGEPSGAGEPRSPAAGAQERARGEERRADEAPA